MSEIKSLFRKLINLGRKLLGEIRGGVRRVRVFEEIRRVGVSLETDFEVDGGFDLELVEHVPSLDFDAGDYCTKSEAEKEEHGNQQIGVKSLLLDESSSHSDGEAPPKMTQPEAHGLVLTLGVYDCLGREQGLSFAVDALHQVFLAGDQNQVVLRVEALVCGRLYLQDVGAGN